MKPWQKLSTALLLLIVLFTASSFSVASAHKLASAPGFIRVKGNKIVNSAGYPVVFHGVNRSGTEYQCIHGYGIFDGPNDATSVQAIAAWHTNVVRVPLNEDCWLGINGVQSQYAGQNYQTAIVNYVNLLNQNGLYAILDLHWSAPGIQQALGQMPMPDQDHSVTFWSQVASTFKSNFSVIFEPFNEPYGVDWNCWLNGGTCNGVGYQVAGMQSLVNAIRSAGAINIISLGGLAYSNDLSQWLTYKPIDPRHNLTATWHVYNDNACNTTTCWDAQAGPVAQKVPIITSEIGENDCAHGFIDGLMSWLDGHQASYLGWTWNPWNCSSGPSLITDYNGTPSNYGIGLRDHLATLP